MAEAQSVPDLLETLASRSRFLVINDGCHLTSDNVRTLAAPENLRALRRGGIQNLAIEMPQEWQPSINQLAIGVRSKTDFMDFLREREFVAQQADPEERKRTHESYADLILNAQSAGIAVRAVDRFGPMAKFLGTRLPAGLELTPQTTIGEMRDSFLASGEKEAGKTLGDVAHRHKLPMDVPFASKEFAAALNEDLVAERVDGDRSLASRIKGLGKNSGKVAAYFGALHGSSRDGSSREDRDLDEFLGETRTSRLVLVPTADLAKAQAADLPDYPKTVVTTKGEAKVLSSEVPQADAIPDGSPSPTKQQQAPSGLVRGRSSR